MTKKFLSILLIITIMFSLLLFTSCKNEESPDSINVIIPAGAPTISMLKLMNDYNLESDTVINYESVPTTNQIVASVSNGEADIAIVPINLAAKLYNKGINYKLAAVTTWGNLYVVSNEEITNIADLKGKEMDTFGLGLIPDIILKKILTENGVDPENDMTLNYLSGTTEIGPLFLSGKSEIALIPEPVLTTVKNKKPDTVISIDIQKEWQNIYGTETGFPQAGIYIKSELVENSKSFVNSFLNEVQSGIEWLNNNPDLAGEYAEELEIGLPAAIVSKAIPGCSISYKNAYDNKNAINNFLQVLLDFDEESIGGKLPEDDFYIK